MAKSDKACFDREMKNYVLAKVDNKAKNKKKDPQCAPKALICLLPVFPKIKSKHLACSLRI